MKTKILVTVFIPAERERIAHQDAIEVIDMDPHDHGILTYSYNRLGVGVAHKEAAELFCTQSFWRISRWVKSIKVAPTVHIHCVIVGNAAKKARRKS